MCRGLEEGNRRCNCDSSNKRRLRLRLSEIFDKWQGVPRTESQTIASPDVTKEAKVKNTADLEEESLKLRQYIEFGKPSNIDEKSWYSSIEVQSTSLGESLAMYAESKVPFNLEQEFTQTEIEAIENAKELGYKRSALLDAYTSFDQNPGQLSAREIKIRREKFEQEITDLEELDEKAYAFTDGAVFKRYIQFEQKYREELSTQYLAVLKKVRKFGGPLKISGQNVAAKQHVLDAVNTYYPSDWVKEAERNSALLISSSGGRSSFSGSEFKDNGGSDEFIKVYPDDQPLIDLMSETNEGDMVPVSLPATFQDSNGVTQSYQLWRMGNREEFDPDFDEEDEKGMPVGEGWKYGYTFSSAMSKRKVWYQSSSVRHADKTHSQINLNTGDDLSGAARHEIGHYFQHFAANGKILKLEDSFVERRTKALNNGTLGIISQIPNAPAGEVYRKAGFLNPYSSRVYTDGNGSEVFTTGMEYIFGHGMAGLIGGYQKTLMGNDAYVQSDKDHRNFILGVLASI